MTYVSTVKQFVPVLFQTRKHFYLGVFLFGLWSTRKIREYFRKAKLHAAVRERLSERDKYFEIVRNRVVDEEKNRQILAYSFKQLQEALQNESVTCVEVLHAYQTKALEIHDRTNCITEFVKEAEEWALELDKGPKTNKPPLFGIPFSVKESIQMHGYDATRGYAQDLKKPSSETAASIEVLKQLGAIAFVRTNVPQSLLSFTCSNPIYGRTLNPFNPDRTSGGSSGGEAALLALGGSPFGVGGDVGGSIRMPAHYSGIAGIKPSHLRVSQLLSKGSVPGRPLISASIGPMALEVDTLATVMKHLTTSLTYDRDPYVPPVPFRAFLYGGTNGFEQKLTIGYYDFDGWFEVVPSVKNAIAVTKERLEAAGHKLVPWTPPRVSDAIGLFFGAATVDSGKYVLDMLDHDLVDPLIEPSIKLMGMKPVAKRIIGILAGPFSPRLSTLLRSFPMTTSELRKIYAQIADYRREFILRWKRSNLDCVLCPPQVSPALPHDVPMKVLVTVSYTAIYNLLDFPAGVVPVSKVSAEDERDTRSYATPDFYSRIIKKANVSGTVGLPIGVQCVALPYEEETCLRLMREVEKTVEPSGENGSSDEGSYENVS